MDHKDSGYRFLVHLFIFCFYLFIFCSGWINALTVIGHHTGAGAVMLFIAFFFSVCAVLKIIMLIKVGLVAFLYVSLFVLFFLQFI